MSNRWNMSQQYKRCNPQKCSNHTNVSDNISNEHKNEHDAKKECNNNPKMKEVNRALIKCNGDCGAPFSKLMEHCIKHKNVEQFVNYANIIGNTFRNYSNPLRKSLITLIRKNNCTEKYKQYIIDLKNKDYIIEYEQQINDIIKLFQQMIEFGDKEILHELANECCKVGVRSLLEEINESQLSKFNELQKKYNVLQETLSIYKGCKEKDTNVLKWIANQINKVKTEIEKQEKAKIEQESNMREYFKRLEQVKQHRNYKKMIERNCGLNDLEILSILFYCDEDQYCYKMRKSHRDKQLNSCEYKNLYYHICCAIDKIYRIFHYKNDKWLKKHIQFDLFSGSTICDLDDKSKQCLNLQTVTSFTKSWVVAKGFAEKIKMHRNDKNGMILTIDNGIKALYNGKLRGADVSWISKFGNEDEYILLPTTFKNFGYLKETQRIKRGWIIPNEYNMYITKDVESTDIIFAAKDIRDEIDALSSWIPSGSPYYEGMLENVDWMIHIFMVIAGPFLRWKCPACDVKSRCMEYCGSFTDLTVECPSCRAYILRSDNGNMREFNCNNPKCNALMTRCDLKKINKSNKWGLDADHGYQCIKCKSQQRIAYLHKVAYNEDTLDRKTDGILKTIDNFIKRYNELSSHLKYHFVNECNVDRNAVKEIVRFMNLRENINVEIFDVLHKFPIIWKWILSIKYVKMILNAYKDGYGDLVDKGLIDESNDINLNADNGEIMGRIIRNKLMNKKSKVNKNNIFEAGIGFLKGLTTQNT